MLNTHSEFEDISGLALIAGEDMIFLTSTVDALVFCLP